MRLFGFQLGVDPEEQKRLQQRPDQVTQRTFALPQNDDGAVTVAGAGYFGTYVDLDGTFRNETQLITKYRELAIQPEMETALDEIVNEAIVHEETGKVVEIRLDNVNLPNPIKKRVEAEFDYVLKLLNFSNMGHEIFRRWYIDGRLYYHVVIDDTVPAAGIQELKYIDPRRIRKIREIQKMKDPQTGIDIIKRQVEYYIYNERGMIGSGINLGSKIAPDSIININSGIMDPKQTMVLSYLHKSIKPFNNLRMVEDATVIYRLSRAPERRVFYIDVGNMPTVKAEQYVRDIMVKYRNKLVYDSNTGEIKDDRKHLSMLEDFWLPRREGSKGTEIDTLEGARNLGDIEDIKYFQTKLYKALGIPISRLEQNNGFSLGRTTEITRDEIKFNKFVQRLRAKFATLFDDLLRVQLLLKNICTEEEWKAIKEDIWYDYKKDVVFDEAKNAEVMIMRLQQLAQVAPFVGQYYSMQWVRKNILKQDEDEFEEINAQMEAENQVLAQQQELAMQQQMGMQQQDMQNQLDFQAKAQLQQAQVSKEVEKIDPKAYRREKEGRDHESTMMDKKIELEKTKASKPAVGAKPAAKKPAAKKAAAKKPATKKVAAKKPANSNSKTTPKKKKTVAEEARELGLIYTGGGHYANSDGVITHLNEAGILTPYVNKDIEIAH